MTQYVIILTFDLNYDLICHYFDFVMIMTVIILTFYLIILTFCQF